MNINSLTGLSLFSLSGLFLVTTCSVLLIILGKYGKSKLHRIWTLFNISIVIWGCGSFLIGKAENPEDAIIYWRIAFTGVIFIAVFFYHFTCLFCQIRHPKMLYFAYGQGLFFLALNFSNLYISKVYFFRDSFYYLKASGYYYPVSVIVWVLFVFLAISEHISYFIKSRNLRRVQALYLLGGFVVGFLGGITNFLPVFGINVYPYGNFTIPIYCIIATYAILKYQLLDIKVAITRAGLFFIVYAFVLGVPFWLGFKLLGMGLWLIPNIMMAILATLGPYLYFYLQKRAEDRLLQEQRRYQTTLRQASAGMGRVKDLNKLLNLIVYIVTRAVQIEHAIVYLYDEVKDQYILGAYKRRKGQSNFLLFLSNHSPVVDYLIQTSAPIIHEEIKQKVQDYKDDQQLLKVEQIATAMQGELIFPVLIEKRLLAIIVLGKKESGKLYTEDDLAVFSILANQTALAIENAQFYDDMKLTQEQLFQAEKMATIGTMADGLSHQINNRFHALGFIAGDALDTIKLNKDKPMPDHLKEVMTDLERAFVRVQENVVQGGEVVQGLLRYTRKGDSGFAAVDFDAAFQSAYEMAQFKIKTTELTIVKEYDKNIPKIYGNFTQLQEVFFNLIDNGYDAMMQRKTEKNEPGFMPTLTIQINRVDDQVEIIFADNGNGVKDEDMHKLFTPFFTTKLSSKKGTGLGLYVIRKIIEENHKGKVLMTSKYMIGTQMKLVLPAFKE